MRTAGQLGAACIVLAVTFATGCSSNSPSRPTGGDWLLERVASGKQVGIHSSLTTTSDGTIHIAYHDLLGKKLFYARRTAPGQWERTQLDTIGWVGRYVTIQADAGDTLHLAYKDIYHDDLLYARYNGQLWQYDRIDPTNSYGISPTLLIQQDGLHLLDMHLDYGRINYWQGGLANWTWNGRITVSSAMTSFGFAIGPDGPALAAFRGLYDYRGNFLGTSYLVLRTSSSPIGPWSMTEIATINGRPSSSPVLEFDGDGILHILYQDQNQVLRDSITGVVDMRADKGILRLRRGQDGDLWLLYPCDNGLALRHQVPAGYWTPRLTHISNLYPDGQYDLHIASDGTVNISVYSESVHELLYGRWKGMP